MSDKAQPLKSALVSQRVPDALKARVKAIYRDYGVDEAVLVRDSLEALCTYIEASGGYRRPVAIVWDEATAKLIKEAGPDALGADNGGESEMVRRLVQKGRQALAAGEVGGKASRAARK